MGGCVGTALLRALRLPFGLPFGREHFVVPVPSASGQHSTLPFVEADGIGMPSLPAANVLTPLTPLTTLTTDKKLL